MEKKLRILFLSNAPTPYRLAFWETLSKEVDLTVLLEMEHSKERNNSWIADGNYGFKLIYLKSIYRGINYALCPEVMRFLKDKSFDLVVVGGYSTPTGILANLYLRSHKIPFCISVDGGTVKKDEKKLNKKIKNFLISGAKWYLSTGKSVDEYLKYYGAKEDGIYRYPFTSLSQKDVLKEPLSNEEKNTLKEKLKLPQDKKIIIGVGQFIHRKAFDVLLDIWDNFSKDAYLLLIGEGPLKEEYLKRNLENVILVDFKGKEALWEYYRASDIFVLPTREDIWGLVINEAMANALPTITTDNCVAGLEMVKDGENGFIVPVEDREKLKEKIAEILYSEKNLSEMPKKALKIAEEYTIESMVKAHISAFRKMIEKKN